MTLYLLGLALALTAAKIIAIAAVAPRELHRNCRKRGCEVCGRD